MNMDMSTLAPTATGMSMATSTAKPGMSGMGGMGGCKISMTWNYFTIGACFISKQWKITSRGMFAGSCIGVILLVIALEFLRRAGKEYDHYLISSYRQTLLGSSAAQSSASSANNDTAKAAATSSAPVCAAVTAVTAAKFRPSVLQQALRALLHMLQFAVAYFIMLLAMYYNAYIIFCIFIGAYLGYFIFGWESFSVDQGRERLQEEVTVCCG